MDYTDDEGIENVTELPKALSQADEPEIVNKKKNKGPLKNHIISKHGVFESSVFFWCETCAQKIHDQKKFTRHMKTHL